MSLFEKFFGPQNTPNSTPPANIPASGNNGTGGELPVNGNIAPENSPNPQPPQQSALDRMAELWKTDPNSQPNNGTPSAVFNLTPEKLSEIAGGVDFSKQLPQEMVQKALGGDPNALAALLNTTAQQSFKTSLDATTKMINAAFAQREKSFTDEVLPGMIDKRMKLSAIEDTNPIFRHPAAKPMLDGLRQQLVSKFPNASAQEVSELAGELLQQFAASLSNNGNSQQQGGAGQQKTSGEVDWATFLS